MKDKCEQNIPAEQSTILPPNKKYGKTIVASFIGYVVQAIVNTFVPLLFLTFQTTYGIPLSKITLLIAVNFSLQLLTDIAATFLVDKIGYRACVAAAHTFAAAGLILLTVLPEAMPNPFAGLVISVVLYAVGGGLLEVVISPIVESCPSEHKDKTMSLLHSFYCWGSVGVAALSALFFFTVGVAHWKILTLLWAAVPVANGIFFMFVPLKKLIEDGEESLGVRKLLKNGYFWLFLVVILCAGASETAVAQWASAFVESSLGIDKALGDLIGPALFAAMMGLSRLLYGKWGDRIDLEKMMLCSGLLCVAAYLLVSLVPVPALSLVGMAVCGFSVGILWPGAYSSASATVKGGGNAMFALLAFGGDLGCISGSVTVGLLTDALGGKMRRGILCAVAFPLLLTVCMLLLIRKKKKALPLQRK